MFGRRQGQQPQAQKGTDLEYALAIDFWQAIKGTQVPININRQETCGVCNGTGGSAGTSSQVTLMAPAKSSAGSAPARITSCKSPRRLR